jgi:hypothetical protein
MTDSDEERGAARGGTSPPASGRKRPHSATPGPAAAAAAAGPMSEEDRDLMLAIQMSLADGGGGDGDGAAAAAKSPPRGASKSALDKSPAEGTGGGEKKGSGAGAGQRKKKKSVWAVREAPSDADLEAIFSQLDHNKKGFLTGYDLEVASETLLAHDGTIVITQEDTPAMLEYAAEYAAPGDSKGRVRVSKEAFFRLVREGM